MKTPSSTEEDKTLPTHAPIVLLRAEEAMQENDGSIARVWIILAELRFVKVESKVQLL